jgi:hypothetical protein
MDKPASSRPFWLTLLSFILIAHLTMFRATYLRLVELGVDLTRAAWSGMLVLYLVIAVFCAWLFIRITTNRFNFVERAERLNFDSLPLRILGGDCLSRYSFHHPLRQIHLSDRAGCKTAGL